MVPPLLGFVFLNILFFHISILMYVSYSFIPSMSIGFGVFFILIKQGKTFSPARFNFLADALRKHSVYNLLEACNVCSCHVVAFHTISLCGIINVVININHDTLKL